MKLMSDSTAEPALDVSPHLAPVVYLTDAVAAVGGRLKDRPEDFIVEEIPAYEPSGTGEHLYLFIQKAN
ncbi:MAG: tRNA pseudouridine(13) synthase TruD, partial [bacterium]